MQIFRQKNEVFSRIFFGVLFMFYEKNSFFLHFFREKFARFKIFL